MIYSHTEPVIACQLEKFLPDMLFIHDKSKTFLGFINN